MKVIDLLNKIANGEEVPEKIAIQNKVLIYNEGEILNLQDCYCMNDDEDATWEIWAYKLNDKVEIIEPQEHKIPEKLDTWFSMENVQNNGMSKEDFIINYANYNFETYFNKINEIIDYLEVNNGIMD